MNSKLTLTLCMICLAIGLYTGYKAAPKAANIDVERVVNKTDVVTVVKEVKRPDGTVETVSTTTDRSVSKQDKQATTVQLVPQWHVSASATKDGWTAEPVYGLQVEKRLVGAVSAGLRVDSKRNIGLVVGLEF